MNDLDLLRGDGPPVACLTLDDVWVPLRHANVVRYALGAFALPPTRLKALRNAALPLVARWLPMKTRVPSRPDLVAAAGDLGAGQVEGWLFQPGASDALSRSVLHLFAPGARRPHAVLKVARVPGYADPFDRDERALALAAAHPVVAEHAPNLLCRSEIDGRHVSLESAAPGPRLLAYLTSAAPYAKRREALETVARWTLDVARETYDGTHVFAHDDLGTWNVHVDGGTFVAVDWESARADGLPLADLTYLLFYGLANLTGATPDATYFAALFGGERPESAVLFEHVRRHVDALDLTEPGALVGAAWRKHGTSHVSRQEALAAHDAGDAATTVTAGCARTWDTDPRLGDGWSAWR